MGPCAPQTIYDLLCRKAEAEAKLLSGLVNKLGDPSRKVASKAGYLLSQLLLQHPAMKPVVVREVSTGLGVVDDDDEDDEDDEDDFLIARCKMLHAYLRQPAAAASSREASGRVRGEHSWG